MGSDMAVLAQVVELNFTTSNGLTPLHIQSITVACPLLNLVLKVDIMAASMYQRLKVVLYGAHLAHQDIMISSAANVQLELTKPSSLMLVANLVKISHPMQTEIILMKDRLLQCAPINATKTPCMQ